MDDIPPFRNEMWNSEYGLKKLRQNSSAENAHDQKALMHCERVRDHTFDLRHLADCVEHSELCNGPALIMPVGSEDQCRAISNSTWLQEVAVTLGDAQTAIFSQWRNLQDMIMEATGVDGRKLQCISELCSLGGLSQAQASLDEDVEDEAELNEEERLELQNRVAFLQECNAEYGLTLDSPDERQLSCMLVGQIR